MNSSGSFSPQRKNSKMHDYTCYSTSESQKGATNGSIDYPLDSDWIFPDLQDHNDQSLQMNGNNCSCSTQPARATSSTTTEDKPTTLTTSSSTVLDHKPSQEKISYSSNRTALPDIGVFDNPGAFIKNLFSLEGERIFHALYFDSVRGEVCIYEDENAKYTLLHSLDLLDHNSDEELDEDFRCLVYAPDPENGAKRVPFHCYEDLQSYHAHSPESHKLVLAKFVPLGCIQKRSLEANKDQKSKRTTNYVLLWNVSTKPHSLWICYDYYTRDDEGYLRRGRLGKPTYYDEDYDDMYGPQTNAFDLETNLESDESASQTLSYEDVFSDENYCRDEADDYELLRQASPTTPLDSRNTPGEGRKANPGYFGANSPFDLAVLASDINEWNGEAGLERDSMYKCLETLRFRLGDTLRARTWVSVVQAES